MAKVTNAVLIESVLPLDSTAPEKKRPDSKPHKAMFFVPFPSEATFIESPAKAIEQWLKDCKAVDGDSGQVEGPYQVVGKGTLQGKSPLAKSKTTPDINPSNFGTAGQAGGKALAMSPKALYEMLYRGVALAFQGPAGRMLTAAHGKAKEGKSAPARSGRTLDDE